jgi:hypothetical protein
VTAFGRERTAERRSEFWASNRRLVTGWAIAIGITLGVLVLANHSNLSGANTYNKGPAAPFNYQPQHGPVATVPTMTQRNGCQQMGLSSGNC